MRVSLDSVIRRFPRYGRILDRLMHEHSTRHGAILLYDYFSREGNSDVVLIMRGALSVAYMLSPHISGRNVLLYWPTSSYHGGRKHPGLLEGNPMPGHPILLFDSDMLSGETARQTAARLCGEGYSRQRMSMYLHLGLTYAGGDPLLDQVDRILLFQKDTWPRGLPEIVKPDYSRRKMILH